MEMIKRSHDSIWDALEDSAELAENMKLRSGLMMALDRQITRAGWSQQDAAAMLGVSQPRISDLVRGKIHLFSLDMLVNMAAAAGMHIEMKIHEPA